MVLTLVTMIMATVLHATTNHLVDAVLALVLMVGGVIGAQFGARAGQKIRSEHLRLLLGLLILSVGIRFAVELVIRPDELYSIRDWGSGGWTIIRIAIIGMLVAMAAPTAHAERLIVSVSNHRVTSHRIYFGEELVLFGSIERDTKAQPERSDYDIVVTVKGTDHRHRDAAQGT